MKKIALLVALLVNVCVFGEDKGFMDGRFYAGQTKEQIIKQLKAIGATNIRVESEGEYKYYDGRQGIRGEIDAEDIYWNGIQWDRIICLYGTKTGMWKVMLQKECRPDVFYDNADYYKGYIERTYGVKVNDGRESACKLEYYKRYVSATKSDDGFICFKWDMWLSYLMEYSGDTYGF